MSGFGAVPATTIIATVVQVLRDKAALQAALTAAEERLQRSSLQDSRGDTPQWRYGVFEGGRLEGGYAGHESRQWPYVPRPPPRQPDPAGDWQRYVDQRDNDHVRGEGQHRDRRLASPPKEGVKKRRSRSRGQMPGSVRTNCSGYNGAASLYINYLDSSVLVMQTVCSGTHGSG
jgi:hypothetical protein